jgi:hypothetical protein
LLDKHHLKIIFSFLASCLCVKGGNANAQIWGLEDKKMCNLPHHLSGKLTKPLIVLLAIFLFDIVCFV